MPGHQSRHDDRRRRPRGRARPGRHGGVWALLVTGVAAALGCGPTAAGAGVVAAGHWAATLDPGDWRTDANPPARELARAAERLAAAGYAPTGSEGRMFIVKEQGVTIPVDVEAGRCYVFASVSSADLKDLDAYLYTAAGAPVDQDRREDAHPVIRHCAEAAGTMYLVFESYDGAGLFYWAQFAAPAGTEIAVSEVFPGTKGEGTAGPEEVLRDLEARARDFADMARPRGFEVTAREEPIHVAAGASHERAVALEAERCYTFAAYGGGGATDVDLYLDAPDGALVALDEEPALDARVQWCPIDSGEFTLRVTMAGAAGDVLIDVLAAPAETVGGLEALWLGTRLPPGPTHLEVAEGIARMKTRLERLGYRVTDDASFSGTAAQLVIRTHSVSLTADKCFVFGGVGGPEVANLDLYLYDSAGSEVVADEALDATPVVQVCPKQSDTFRLDVAMRRGDGPYRIVRGESPVLGAEARGLDTVARTRLRTVSDRIRLAELSPLGSPQTRRLSERGVLRFQNMLDAGACYLFVAVGGAGVVDIDMVVLDPASDIVVRDYEPDAMPVARFCAASSGAHSTDVRMIEGTGEFTLLQYTTPR